MFTRLSFCSHSEHTTAFTIAFLHHFSILSKFLFFVSAIPFFVKSHSKNDAKADPAASSPGVEEASRVAGAKASSNTWVNYNDIDRAVPS